MFIILLLFLIKYFCLPTNPTETDYAFGFSSLIKIHIVNEEDGSHGTHLFEV